MKILKHGDKVSHVFRCSKCRCEFEAFGDEYVYHPARKYKDKLGGEYNTYDYWESYCPECGERVFD